MRRLHLITRRTRLSALAAHARAASTGAKRLNLCVIGGGRMAEIRASHITAATSTNLAAVVDTNSDAARALSGKFASAPFGSLADAAAASAAAGRPLDGAWICAPSPAHPSLIGEAAALGLHVAVEKPVALTVSDIAAAYAACAERGVSLSCAFQRRADPSYAALASAVARGDAGVPRSIKCTFRDHPTPSADFLLGGGGDVYHDLATHDIDFALRLVATGGGGFGAAPDEVYAIGSASDARLAAAGVDDGAIVVLTWRSRGGAAVVLDLSRSSAYGYDQRCEVFGDAAVALRVDNPPRDALVALGETGETASLFHHSFPQRFDAAFRAELDAFAAVCRGETTPAVSRDDAVLATLVAEAALVSARTGAPVTIANPTGSDDPADLVLAEGPWRKKAPGFGA